MSIKDMWKNRKRATVSFEIFPARDEKAAKKLDKAIDGLLELRPDFVSVTFGAGGHNRAGSYDLVQRFKKVDGLEVLPYLAAYGLSPDEIVSIVEAYRGLGIDALFCIRGDEPEAEGFQAHPDSFGHASDFIEFLNGRFDIFTGAAGYPEGHITAESKEKDLEFLKLKVDKGARYIIAQYVYDTGFFIDFVKRCRAIGIDVPILAGVMPIYTVKMTKNLASMCGATISQKVKEGLAQLPPDDKKAVTAFGVDFATQQCRELLKSGVDGIHFYTMDKSKSVAKIITNLREEGLL
ncbi:MAG: 5,10-methylenetetrahydrofolate reductase [bacterium]|nr:5,10-methylenetetrahydrofolate reductase [bacterium]